MKDGYIHKNPKKVLHTFKTDAQNPSVYISVLEDGSLMALMPEYQMSQTEARSHYFTKLVLDLVLNGTNKELIKTILNEVITYVEENNRKLFGEHKDD